MMIDQHELTCNSCSKDFTVKLFFHSDYGSQVKCSHCGSWLETEVDEYPDRCELRAVGLTTKPEWVQVTEDEAYNDYRADALCNPYPVGSFEWVAYDRAASNLNRMEDKSL